MTTAIDFYFDFSSPYGYFAALGIDALAEKYARSVKWHPVLLGVVFKTTGSAPLPTIPMKGEYSLHDIERTARFHGIPYRRPAVFPVSTQIAARAMLFVQKTQGDAQATAFAKATYCAYFADGINIGDPESIGKIASDMGLHATALLEAANSVAIKDQLKNEVAMAMVRGVFGSPFMIVDGESFWGFDRFGQLEAYLADGKI